MAATPPRHFLHQNRLLRALTPATVHQVLLALQPLALRLKDTLITPNAPITAVYFPLDAVISVVSTLADGSMLEVATIGNEGVVGLPRFLQGGCMPFTAVVQVPGAALKMEAEVFAQAVGEVGSDFYGVLARYTQVWCTQLGQHAVCNRVHRVVERCAHWLLQTQDRVGRAEFPLTQEFLAVMLGVRRTSVTEVARQLQQGGLIRYHRGLIHVLDRPGLEAASCGDPVVYGQKTAVGLLAVYRRKSLRSSTGLAPHFALRGGCLLGLNCSRQAPSRPLVVNGQFLAVGV